MAGRWSRNSGGVECDEIMVSSDGDERMGAELEKSDENGRISAQVGRGDQGRHLASNGAVVGWLPSSGEAEWDAFVANHPRGSFFYESRWRHVLRDSFSHMEGRVAVVRTREDGRILGGLTVYRAKSWLLGDRLVSVPFASFVEPAISKAEDLKMLVDFLDAHRREEKVKRVELRLVRMPEFQLPAGWRLRPGFKHHYLDLRQDLDEILGRV